MAIERFPGNVRIGVLHKRVTQVESPCPDRIEAKVLLMVLLAGHQRFRVDDSEFTLSTRGRPAGAGGAALLLRLERPAELQYLSNSGDPLVKLSVATDPGWLDAVCPQGALRGHGAFRMVEMDEPFARVAGRLVGTARGPQPAAARLSRLSLGLELLRRALELSEREPVSACDPAPAGPPAWRTDRVLRVLDAHLDDPAFGAEELALACGMSLRTLQRACRDGLDQTPADLIRLRRLEAAAEALRLGRISVGQAAYRAGYSTQGNFATAFKRHFGVSPSALRS